MDIALLITEFLKDKNELRDFENDSLSIVDNQIASWDFKNIPCPTRDELFACEEKVIAEKNRENVLKQISELENKITPRRIREAMLTGDNTFIQDIESQIIAIRELL